MIKINCSGSNYNYALIDLPTPLKGKDKGIPYLWFGVDGKFLGTIEDIRTLKKLKRMIDKIIKEKTLTK